MTDKNKSRILGALTMMNVGDVRVCYGLCIERTEDFGFELDNVSADIDEVIARVYRQLKLRKYWESQHATR